MEGKRPGGLTALAVINFILGGLGLLGVLSVFAAPALLEMVPTTQSTEQEKKEIEETKQLMKDPKIIGLTLANGVCALLLLASGVGYLQQKKMLGRSVGNCYAVLRIGIAVAEVALVAGQQPGGFSIISLVSFIYPVVTLVLLNTTFREDFVN